MSNGSAINVYLLNVLFYNDPFEIDVVSYFTFFVKCTGILLETYLANNGKFSRDFDVGLIRKTNIRNLKKKEVSNGISLNIY